MRVSVKFLEQHAACEDQLELFKQFLGKREYVLTTQRNLTLADKFGLDVEWLACKTTGVFTFTSDTGTEYWYLDGKRHRTGGPSISYSNGDRYWHYNGLLHREDGPAVQRSRYGNQCEMWYEYGRLHRLDGPAMTCSKGEAFWYKRGLLHRSDGPAVVTGEKVLWYMDGVLMQPQWK